MVGASAYSEARLQRASEALEKLGLSSEYLELLAANPSRDFPYHGNEHQLAVANLAYRMGYTLQLGDNERRALFLAGLFHDQGYDLNEEDSANIGQAIALSSPKIYELNPELLERVVQLIAETEVPRSRPKSLAASILQDADLLMVTQPDADEFLQGLALERPGTVIDPRFPGEAALNNEIARRLYRTAMELRESGRKVEDPLLAVSVGNTHHQQTLSSRGFLVDTDLLEVLELLWAQGYETVYSCSGDPAGEIALGFDEPIRSYIAFVNTTEAQEEMLMSLAFAMGSGLEYFDGSEGSLKATVLRFYNWRIADLLTITRYRLEGVEPEELQD